MPTTAPATGIQRFRSAQDKQWHRISRELTVGRKESHWMWFVFPKLRPLAKSETADFYGLADKQEALAYLDDPTLRSRLAQATLSVLRHPRLMFDRTDANRFRSSMTLFGEIVTDPRLPNAAIQRFYGGEPCQLTLDVLAGREIPRQWVRPAPHRPTPGRWSGSAQGRVMTREWGGFVDAAARRRVAEAARQATIFDTRDPMSAREIEAFLIKHGVRGEALQQVTDRWMEDQADAAQQGWDNCEAEQLT